MLRLRWVVLRAGGPPAPGRVPRPMGTGAERPRNTPAGRQGGSQPLQHPPPLPPPLVRVHEGSRRARPAVPAGSTDRPWVFPPSLRPWGSSLKSLQSSLSVELGQLDREFDVWTPGDVCPSECKQARLPLQMVIWIVETRLAKTMISPWL